MKIRLIELDDLQQCANILQNEYSKAPYNEVFKDQNSLLYIESKYRNAKNSCFVMEDNWIIVWFCFSSISCWSNGLQWILEEIVVNEEYQWKWIWKKLYLYMENFFKSLWIKSILLWVQNDTNAYNFHTKNWFVRSEEHTIMFKDI